MYESTRLLSRVTQLLKIFNLILIFVTNNTLNRNLCIVKQIQGLFANCIAKQSGQPSQT